MRRHSVSWPDMHRLMVGTNFVLHPLIHTLLKFNLAQDIGEYKQAEPKLRSVFEK